MVWLLFIITYCFIEIIVFNANSVDPDQMPQNVASDLGLHFLPTFMGLNTKMDYYLTICLNLSEWQPV